jgi:hypothetical protein
MASFFGKVKDSQFHPDNRGAWLKYLENNDDKTVFIQIERETGVRSRNQNSWLWAGVYKPIADATGHSENEIHEIMKRKFIKPQAVTWRGQEIKMPGSTTELDKIEFSDYVERIRAEVAPLGITIPDPHDPHN